MPLTINKLEAVCNSWGQNSTMLISRPAQLVFATSGEMNTLIQMQFFYFIRQCKWAWWQPSYSCIQNGGPGKRHHVQLLHTRGHVTCGTKINHANEATAWAAIVVRPVVPAVRPSFHCTNHKHIVHCEKKVQRQVQDQSTRNITGVQAVRQSLHCTNHKNTVKRCKDDQSYYI